MRVDRVKGKQALDTLHATLERLKDGSGPIIVGPWLTEVGYELLYWIPFVAWAQHAYALDPDRLIVVSRGGVSSWYAHLTSRYVDILSLMTPDAFRAANQHRIKQTGHLKQFTVTPMDKHILATVTPGALLHPSLMYQLFFAFKPWEQGFRAFTRHQPFRPVPRLEGLPARYTAVRFYESAICPDTLGARKRVAERMRALLADGDVVWLDPGIQCDDHQAWDYAQDSPRFHRIADRMTPATNLDIQTRAIAGADKFVGTYGGYAYLPPMLGVPSDTIYGHRPAIDKLRHHVGCAREVFGRDRRYGSLAITSLAAPQRAYAYA